jgi:hypothetical protein
MRSTIFLSVFAFLVLTPCVLGVYFKIEEGQTRCFLEEVPKDFLVVGSFKSEEAAGGVGT